MLSALHRARRAFVRTGIVAIACVSVSTACSNNADPVSPRGITELTGPSTAVSVGQGFSTKSVVSIKRSSAFDGTVQLTAEALPTGMLVSFAPSSLSGTATLAEMTINAMSTLSPGAHTFTVRASGEAVESRTVTVSVMVTVPAITVAAASTTPTVMQGATQQIPITITREGGFTGIVGLSVLGLPAGVTAAFAPATIESGATTSTLTLSSALTVQPGVKTVTLRASSQGIADKTIPMEVTIAPTTTPAVLLSANPPFLQLDGGSSGETVLTLQRFAGFDGAVEVSLDGLPATLTATITPFAAGSNTTSLRITVSDQELNSNYQLTVRGTGVGIQQASTGLAVQTRLMPQFNMSFPSGLPLTPATLTLPVTINRGAAAVIPLSISRASQYDLPIALTMAGTPLGVTTNLPATVSSSPTSQTFNITVNVAADAVPGVYNLRVRGETTTPMVREVTIVLTVN